jgi:hypothetical protein
MRNPEFTNVDGPMPHLPLASARFFTLKAWTPWFTVDKLSEWPLVAVSEFTHIGGLVPTLAFGHGLAFHLRNLRPAAYNELTLRMSLNGHFNLGSHEFAHIDQLTLTSNFYPGQVLHLRSLDPMAGSCPPSSVFATGKTWLLRAHMSDGTLNRHVVLLRAIMQPSGTPPHGVKFEAKARPLE